MRVEESLAGKKTSVERELERLLSISDSLLFQAMRYAVLSGGKRFRPLLALSSGECFGVEKRFVLPFACALEMIHNYSLIHDDLPSMDNDDFRRGRPSCHKAFGEDIALLAGDSLLTYAFEIMAYASLPASLRPQKEQLIRDISHFAGPERLIEGQLLDITLKPDELTEKTMHELISKKTGALIMAAVRSGAILGKASPAGMEAMTAFGMKIGLAFQIKDDILDSGESGGKASPSRPNYVSFFGPEEAGLRLEKYVHEGIRALENASLSSPELKHLALQILDHQ